MFQPLDAYLINSAKIFKDKVAVRFKDRSITYSSLDAFVNKIANGLRACGLTVGSRIGIYMDKSIETIAALFGTLRAGCAYVPLDCCSPQERIKYMIKDCQLDALFIDENKLGTVKDILTGSETRFVFNLSPASAISSSQTEFAFRDYNYFSRNYFDNQDSVYQGTPQISENTPAYILYTSGSTGKPKGVVLSHKNATTFINWAADYFRVSERDVIFGHTPIHFDLSVFDIYVALRNGAELCLAPPGITYFPAALVEFVEKNKITIWYSVPSVFIQIALFGNLEKKNLDSLRLLLYAGEVFYYPYLNMLRKKLKNTEIVNCYGLTETNVITVYNLKNSPHNLTENVPIGFPCPYAEIRIVDENNCPVERGAEGELIVRGDSVMMGYWNNEEETRRVIKNVTIDGVEKSFFFTGDIVVQDRDGRIFYKNRRDNIIKTRGFRVDLGEIESTLYKNEDIREAVVVAIPDERIGNRIKAVIVPKEDNRSISSEEIKRFCERFLPFYMVPEIIEFRSDLPRTSTGKLDKKSV